MLENYVQKERSSRKNENKLVETVLTNQEAIQNMNTYYDQEIQTEEEKSSVRNPSSSSQNNSFTNDLYPLEH